MGRTSASSCSSAARAEGEWALATAPVRGICELRTTRAAAATVRAVPELVWVLRRSDGYRGLSLPTEEAQTSEREKHDESGMVPDALLRSCADDAHP